MAFHTQVRNVDPASISFQGDSLVISNPESKSHLVQAAEILKTSADPVAFPTETVYGLGGSALNTEAVKNIYKSKNRPADNPLILHVSSVDQLKRKLLPNTDIPPVYLPLIKKFWPGPLTILLPVPGNTEISPATTVGQPTFAVRLPAHPVARALIALSDLPLAAPSANTSTRPSPTLARHVYKDLQGKIPLILDGGPCDVGVESTVVDGLSNPPVLLRPGGVSAEDIMKYGGEAWRNLVIAKGEIKDNEVAKTPGMKYKHYSPTAMVVLFKNCGADLVPVENYLKGYIENNKSATGSKIALLASLNFDPDQSKKILAPYNVDVFDLGNSAKEMSRNLFAELRRLDEEDYSLILVEGVDETNDGLAVMNRLTKASSHVIDGSTK